MANFTPFKFTSVGLDLEYEAQAGKVLNFSKFVLGDGEYGGSIRDLTNLINPIREEPITRFEIVETGAKKRIRIGFSLDTTQITEGFYLREIGLFAKDPDTGNDILMFYTNAGETADYISNNTSTTVTTKLINAEVYIDDVAEITATIDSSLVYALAKDTYNKTEVDEKIENINIKFEADIEEINDKLNYLDENKYNIPSKIASGENVYIEDAFGSPLVSLSGEGKSEQVTTQGYNLLDMTKAVTTTQNGITMTVNKNGSLTFNRTGTGSFWFVLSDKNVSLKAGTYTWVLNPSYVLNSGDYSISLRDNTNTVLSSIGPDKKNIKFTLSEDKADLFFAIYIANNSYTFNNLTIYPMLLSGEYETSTIPPFEPYTGGQASPNPDYKQEIETVTEAEYKGVAENLYNYKDTSNVSSDVTIDEEGWITISYDNSVGTSSVFKNYMIAASNLILPNTNYSVITEIKSVSGNGNLHLNQDQPLNQFKTTYSYSLNTLKNGDVKILKLITKDDITQRMNMLHTFVSISAGQSGSITFRISILADTSITAENFVYKPYQEVTLTIDLQGNKLCELDKLLIDKKGNVAIEKNICKLIFDGSESCSLQSINDYGIANFYIKHNLTLNPTELTSTISNYFIQAYTLIANTTIEGMYLQDKGVYFRIKSSTVSTVEEFKAWLSEHNTEIYCKLATPEIINLGTIENPEIFKGINNIIVETNLGNMSIEVEYSITDLNERFSEIYKDISTINNNINEVNEKVNEISDKIKGDIPTKLSELENDTGFKSIEASTTDLEAGVSELATGKIYLVYE